MTPIAEIVGGSLRWHVPHDAYAVPVEYLNGAHMLYAVDAPQLDQARTELHDALRGLYTVLRDRYYGRMPDEVQAAYDKAGDLLRRHPPGIKEQHD